MKHLEEEYRPLIESLLGEGFEKDLLEAAFINLNTPNALRFNNFAYAMRELLRHVLHRLAPKEALEACNWFKPDDTSRNGITRKHRIKYAIQGGLSDYMMKSKLSIDYVDEVIQELVKQINDMSKFTHIEHDTFDIPEDEVERLARECLAATTDFISTMHDTHREVCDHLGEAIDMALLKRIFEESVEEIMELSTHQHIDDIYHESVNVEEIGSKSLTLEVSGQLECELQYGSSSDMRRGDGVTISESFPFKSNLTVFFEAPLGSVTELNSFNVDNREWYGIDDDLEPVEDDFEIELAKVSITEGSTKTESKDDLEF
ncbi:Uncharacterised protein [Vibrio owensii]|uniref:pPIWI-associating nuclease domain-containing protein n=1 Tax=Vibrio harveyi group TaxID=717610 RepID=UPI00039C2BD5|nr:MULTISPECIES: hypothetical protein [Vibrio harveyi group]MCR9586559.1 hypothetical protein [Vibrio alginolyticus]SUP37462.1 Uncharacterised protein [Vibrio owensii]